MGEDRPQGREPEASLELPTFGLRRRRDKTAATEPAPEQDVEPTPDPTPGTGGGAGASDAQLDADGAAVTTDPVLGTPPDDAVDDPAASDQPTRVFPTGAPAATPATETATEQHPAAPAPRPSRPGPATTGSRRRMPLPTLGGGAAALVTGLVVGLVGVGLTLLALGGCEAVVGTSSCGGAGFFLLMAILVLMVVLGRFLLDAWAVRDPGSTSFLAVGLVTVVALLFLVEALLSWTMLIVIPAVTMAAFALSQWITTTVTESGPNAMD
jgi:hypothetical protein